MATNNYIDNKQLYKDICAHLATDEVKAFLADRTLPRPVIPDNIGEQFILIANNFAKLPTWGYIKYKEELIGDAIVACVRGYYSFNPEMTTNPFSYFTTTCYRAFLGVIKSHKKYETSIAAQIDEMYLGFIASSDNASGVKISPETLEQLMKTKDDIADLREKFAEEKEAKKETKPKKPRLFE